MITVKRFSLWLLLVFLIIFRYFSVRPVYKNGDTVYVSATVFFDLVSYPNSQSLKAGGLKISLPIFPEINYGDHIVVEGIVDNGKLKNAKLISDSPNQGFGSGLRNKIIAFYQKTLPEPMLGLIAGTVLGVGEK